MTSELPMARHLKPVPNCADSSPQDVAARCLIAMCLILIVISSESCFKAGVEIGCLYPC
jgi:hypothetical protein